jgi:hypothetical protein
MDITYFHQINQDQLQTAEVLLKTKLNKFIAAVAMVFLTTTSTVRADLLDGQTVWTTLGVYFGTLIFAETSGDVVVGPGTEITNFDFGDLGAGPGMIVDIDFSDTNILVTNRGAEFRCPVVCYLRFEDAYGTIPRFTSATFNPVATTWPGYSRSLRVDPNDFGFSLRGGFPGAQISLDITGMIPEPATACLMLMSLAFLVTGRRRFGCGGSDPNAKI